MAREHCNSDWSIADVMASMLKEIQIFEMSQQCTSKTISHDTTMPTTGSFHTSTHKLPPNHHSNDEKLRRGHCVFCKGDHTPIKVVDPKERLAIVRQENLCYNYLAKHRVTLCYSKFTCREYRKRHHTSLCHAFVISDTPSTPVNTPQPVNNVSVSTQQSIQLKPHYNNNGTIVSILHQCLCAENCNCHCLI